MGHFQAVFKSFFVFFENYVQNRNRKYTKILKYLLKNMKNSNFSQKFQKI